MVSGTGLCLFPSILSGWQSVKVVVSMTWIIVNGLILTFTLKIVFRNSNNLLLLLTVDFIFQNNFVFIAKLSRRSPDLLYHPLPLHIYDLLHYQCPHQSGTCVKITEPTLIDTALSPTWNSLCLGPLWVFYILWA